MKLLKVVVVVVVVVVLLSEAGDGVEVALVKPDLLVVCHGLLDEVLDVAVIAVGGLNGADVGRFNLLRQIFTNIRFGVMQHSNHFPLWHRKPPNPLFLLKSS